MKKHKILTGLSVICIWGMIKNSSIPYLVTPPAFWAFIFDKPRNDFFSSVMQMTDIFSSAYVTSLLFYYMVDYLPAFKQEKKAKEIIDAKLVSIYLYISEFLAMIEFSAKQDNLYNINELEMLNNLSFKNQDIYCKKVTLKNEIETATIPYTYNLLKDGNKYKTLIKDSCTNLAGIPSFSYCDIDIVNIISKIQLLDLLQTLPPVNEITLNLNVDICCMSLGKDYQRLLLLKDELGKTISVCWNCKMIDISAEEINKWQSEQANVFMEQPELINIIARINQN